VTPPHPPFRDVAGRPKGPLDAGAWNDRWAEGETGWDMGHAAPPFVSAVGEGLIEPPGRVLVIGCGAGHDARFLAAQGFDVTGIDVAPLAIERARVLDTEETVDYRVADLFALPDDGDYRDVDVVLEHTCFCAIPPHRRDEYVGAVARVLRRGGNLLGLFFIIEPEEGPPFGATEAEIRHRFGGDFHICLAREPQDSHPERQGREMLFQMERRA